ncbi:MAG: RpiB/LacA/LacB family sugar-phosphate isomerase [bacterium]|nr:RpiB/LacA/LacB family sugar-phosphate isomerase [Candidatus Jorgensenbacteria bacterium]
MVIYIGSDHKGYQLKKEIVLMLKNGGYEVSDLGNVAQDENDDYPDFAAKVAERVSRDIENAKGILICGSGVGMCVVANKFANIRAALVASSDQAFDSKNDDNANILCLGANYLSAEQAKKIVLTWSQTPFSEEERHTRRLQKIEQVEQQLLKTTGEQ